MTLRRLESTPLIPQPSFGHAHFWERALSRRQMIATTLGAAGAVAAAGLLKPTRALAGTNADPRPIPGGIIVGGQGWHVSGPGPNNPVAGGAAEVPGGSAFAEMSTIYDFDGTVAGFTVQGTGTGRQGGVALPLAFDTDMRFMRGRYRGMDGRVYRGTFGFIGLDVYAGQVAALGVPQIHDYNPGVAASGLFWTIRIPDGAVGVDSKATTARYALDDVALGDYVNVETALAGAPPTGTVRASFAASWKATGKPFKFSDSGNKFTGVYRMAESAIEWQSIGSGFSFRSDPAATSKTTFSAIGRERNGIFFS